MRLLQLVEDPDLDEEKVDAIRPWAAGILSCSTPKLSNTHSRYSGIDLLLP